MNIRLPKKKKTKNKLQEYLQSMSQHLQPNDLVKINYDKIVNAKDYKTKNPNYKSLVEYVKDKVCIVSYENEQRQKAHLVSLYIDGENGIEPWLFHESDLIKLTKEQAMDLASKNK